MRTEKAFTDESAASGDGLRGRVVGIAGQLEAGETQIVKDPASEEQDGVGGDAAPPSLWIHPVADGEPSLVGVDAVQGATAEYHVRVERIDHREGDFACFGCWSSGVFSEEAASIGFCVGIFARPGELLEHGITQPCGDRVKITVSPSPQNHDLVAQRGN